MRIAYLVNQYPKVSHTFIRREIAALERLGIEVERWSVRDGADGLVDDADRAEVERTRVVLSASPASLLSATLGAALAAPGRFAAAATAALRIGRRTERGALRHLAYLVEACVVRRWARAAGVKHVHAHFGTNPATVAWLAERLGGPSFSFTVHGPEEFDRPRELALGRKLEAARFTCAISSFGRSQLCRWTGHEHWDSIVEVHCAVDPGFLDAPLAPMPDAPRFVSVGRLCEQKAPLLLVEAFARTLARRPDARLVLVGDGELRGEVEALARRRGADHAIEITGWADAARVRREIEQASVFVLPSFAEGLPVAIMEALALGRPVLSTYVAGIPELVRPGEHGWLVPAGSVDDLEAALLDAASTSPEALAAMGRAGRERVRTRHHPDVEAARLAEHLAEAIGTTAPSPGAAPRNGARHHEGADTRTANADPRAA